MRREMLGIFVLVSAGVVVAVERSSQNYLISEEIISPTVTVEAAAQGYSVRAGFTGEAGEFLSASYLILSGSIAELTATPAQLPPQIISASVRVRGAQLQFSIMGQPGQTLAIEASDNLVKWDLVEAKTVTDQPWTFFESANLSRRFYRAVVAP